MSEELECFRQAAKLGCPDFRWNENVALPEFSVPFCGEWQMLPMDGEDQINRYAAAVCAEFLHNWVAPNMVESHKRGELVTQARAFGKKYGAQ